MANYITTDTELTSIADAIRAKGGTVSPLAYPAGFISAINDISGGGPSISSLNITPTSQSQVFYGAVSKSSVYASPTVNYNYPFDFSPDLIVGSTYFANIKFYTQEGYYLASESNLFFVCESDYVILNDDTGVQVSPSQGKCINKGIYDYIALKVYETDQTTAFAPVTVLGYANSLGSKNITTNGTYNASSDGYVGYSQVTVNVSLPSENKELDIIQRTIGGTYENAAVSVIGDYAFCQCRSLKSVIFSGCTNIGSGAFMSCSSLKTISFPEATYIGMSAFFDCDSLATVSFSKVTSVGANAFRTSKLINTASFPLLEIVPDGMFGGCSYLSSVYMPVCTSIGSGAFTWAIFDPSFPECITIGNEAFHYARIESMYFPKVKTISTSAFCDCGSYPSVINFPLCETIGAYAFLKSDGQQIQYGLSEFNAPECKSIGAQCFKSAYIKSISIPKCESMGSSVFLYASYLVSCYAPMLSIIPGSTFYACSRLSDVCISSCKTIGFSAFFACYSLSSINCPEVSTISANAFYDCRILSNIYLPKCQTIASSAFYSCSSLMEISLPLCSYIGNYAFAKCTNLSKVIIGTDLSTITSIAGINIFSSVSSICNIYVPDSLVAAYKTSTGWTAFSTTVGYEGISIKGISELPT